MPDVLCQLAVLYVWSQWRHEGKEEEGLIDECLPK
jgi:hypothetical protein